MPSTEFHEWLNANAGRSYPLSEVASKLSESGSARIPNSLIVNAMISAPSTYGSGVFYVSRVISLPGSLAVTVSYDSGSGASEVATVQVDPISHSENYNYAFAGGETNPAVLGSLTIGDISSLDFIGAFNFTSDAAPFEVSVLSLSQPAVDAIELEEGGEVVASMSGAIKLLAGSNVRLTRVAEDTIRIDAISGENLDDCGSEDNPAPIRFINGVPPDEDGNIRLDGSECVEVVLTAAAVLTIMDSCSKPCCGCAELSGLVEALRQMESQRGDISALVYRAQAEHLQLISNLTRHLAG